MIFGADLYRDDVNKISFVLNSYEDYLAAASEFPELKAGTWGGTGGTALFGDLALKEIDKAYAMMCFWNIFMLLWKTQSLLGTPRWISLC